jgi:hypothetical protein
MSYLRYSCLLAYNGVQHILCCVFGLFFFILPPVVCKRVHVLFTLAVFVCIQWCPTHIMLCFWFVFVYPMLPVSLDCPCFTAHAYRCPKYNGTKHNNTEDVLCMVSCQRTQYQIQRETTQYNAQYDQIFVLDSSKIKK